MTHLNSPEAVKQTVQKLIDSGSSFDVDALSELYHDDLRIIKIDEASNVTEIDKAENLEFFRAKRDNNASPLSRAVEFNHITVGEYMGHALVTRKMKLEDRFEKSVFSIHLVKDNEQWKIIHETAFVRPV